MRTTIIRLLGLELVDGRKDWKNVMYSMNGRCNDRTVGKTWND